LEAKSTTVPLAVATAGVGEGVGVVGVEVDGEIVDGLEGGVPPPPPHAASDAAAISVAAVRVRVENRVSMRVRSPSIVEDWRRKGIASLSEVRDRISYGNSTILRLS
jgi:hypothetical protein